MNVPDELIKIGKRAWHESSPALGGSWNVETQVRAILGVVLERHEAMVLQRASEKLMARAEEYAGAHTGPRATWRRALQAAARHILPTPTPQQVADAIADGTALVVGCPSLDEEIARGDAE